MLEKQPLSIFNVSENVQENQQQKVYFWHILDFQKQITDNSCGYLHSLLLPNKYLLYVLVQ